jgi:hypothetical protein
VRGEQCAQLVEGLLLVVSFGTLDVGEQLADTRMLVEQDVDDVAVRPLDGFRRLALEIAHFPVLRLVFLAPVGATGARVPPQFAAKPRPPHGGAVLALYILTVFVTYVLVFGSPPASGSDSRDRRTA